MVRGAKRVGDTALARAFFAGRYAEIARQTFDAKSPKLGALDVAFAVGALTFLGRLEDAEVCFEAHRARGKSEDARTAAAVRFFLGVAHARAGDFKRAHGFLVRDVRASLRSGDAWSRVFVHQGLACYRYFTGRYAAAARHAQRALSEAQRASFAYGKLLATDLRGHALVHIGAARAGLALLEQARMHALHLGLENNAFAIGCSIASYAARFRLGDEPFRELEALIERPGHDAYSRHGLLTEYAEHLALRGRATDARRALERADEEALRVDMRRAKAVSLLAHLHVARWSRGTAACAELLREAETWVGDADLTFRAELEGFGALVAKAMDDKRGLRRRMAALTGLVRVNHLYTAKAWLDQLGMGHAGVRALSEDPLTSLLEAVVAQRGDALPRLIAAGALGAVSSLLGFGPGRRVLVLLEEDAVLLEEHGDVVLQKSPPRWCTPLLQLLAHGDAPKELIVQRLWGLRNYRPERHDPLLRTAIHRLRNFLGPFASWVRVTARGYGTSVPVFVVGRDVEAEDASPVPVMDEESAIFEVGRAEASVRSPAPPQDARFETRVTDALTRHEPASVPELARVLHVSESTVLRTLRKLVRDKKVRRRGHARSTRYTLL